MKVILKKTVVVSLIAGASSVSSWAKVAPSVESTVEVSLTRRHVDPGDLVTVEKKFRLKPKVQVALLLDTSGSMDGLIDQAKTQLWTIVNSFAKVEKGGEVPTVEVALYEYGNDGISIKDNYIRKVSGLTSELDDISEKLFSLKTNGGSEFCGAAIKQALDDLKWDSSSEVYKAIFIAGNEPFTQGSISATKSCQRAIREGVVVNTIHCGKEQEGIEGGWKAGAIAAEGDFLLIDQDKAVVHISAPQDKVIIKLSQELNTTYIPMGSKGLERKQNQGRQDSFALSEQKKGTAYNRAVTKSSSLYNNASWDVVDYCEANEVSVSSLDEALLPEEMKGLSDEERESYVKEKESKRVEIQKQIQSLKKERDAYIQAEQSKLNLEEETLDVVMAGAIYKQIEKNGFKVKSEIE